MSKSKFVTRCAIRSLEHMAHALAAIVTDNTEASAAHAKAAKMFADTATAASRAIADGCPVWMIDTLVLVDDAAVN